MKKQQQRELRGRTARKSPGRSQAGFTLTELMIVVAILGLLMALAIPNFVRARENSLNSRYAADMRVAADAFIMYAQERGNYPPDVYPGIMPEGMPEYLKRMDWLGRTPLGGQWDWDNWPRVKGVSALEVDAGPDQLLRIDRLLDDGNLGGGAFRDRGGGSTYIYILEGSL